MVDVEIFKFTGAFLVAVGIYTALSRSHFIGVLIGLELAFNGAVVLIVSYASATAITFALLLIAFAVAEASVGLAILIKAKRKASPEVKTLSKFRF